MKKILATFALLATLTACGGDAGGRPTTSDIADALRDKDNQLSSMTGEASDEAIDCIATAFHDSDLSDDALQALVDGDEDYQGSTDDEDAITGLTDEIATCITA